MRLSRVKLWIAGAVAFLLGFPLSKKAMADAFDIFSSSLNLGLSIADSAGDS